MQWHTQQSWRIFLQEEVNYLREDPAPVFAFSLDPSAHRRSHGIKPKLQWNSKLFSFPPFDSYFFFCEGEGIRGLHSCIRESFADRSRYTISSFQAGLNPLLHFSLYPIAEAARPQRFPYIYLVRPVSWIIPGFRCEAYDYVKIRMDDWIHSLGIPIHSQSISACIWWNYI